MRQPSGAGHECPFSTNSGFRRVVYEDIDGHFGVGVFRRRGHVGDAGFLVYRIVKPQRSSSEINMDSFRVAPTL